MDNCRRIYIITGISGYIGSSFAEYVLGHDNEAWVIGISRHSKDAVSRISDCHKERLILSDVDVSDEKALMDSVYADLELIPDDNVVREILIVHCAATTQSRQMIDNPEGTYNDIVAGSRNIISVGAKAGAKALVFLSTMEVYGSIESGNERAREDVKGYIDEKNPRSCYPLAKRKAEEMFRQTAADPNNGMKIVIVRPAQVFGKGISKNDNRVFAQFARAAGCGNDIVLHTEGTSYGNYCEIEDAVRGIICALEKGTSGETYNIVNEDLTMRIRDMAELVARDVAGGTIKVVYDIPEGNPYGYAASTGLKMSGEKLMKLGWKPVKNMKQMYLDVINYSIS